jgi:hypothetical protein
LRRTAFVLLTGVGASRAAYRGVNSEIKCEYSLVDGN